MRYRANPASVPVRVLACLLALIVLLPHCIAQFPAVHTRMSGMMTTGMTADGMGCCPATSAIQAPSTCCLLDLQPAGIAAATPSLTIPSNTAQVLAWFASIPAPAPHTIHIPASRPPLLHPILRI